MKKIKTKELLPLKVSHFSLTLLHSEWLKLYGVLAVLSAIGLKVFTFVLPDVMERKMEWFIDSCYGAFTDSSSRGAEKYIQT